MVSTSYYICALTCLVCSVQCSSVVPEHGVNGDIYNELLDRIARLEKHSSELDAVRFEHKTEIEELRQMYDEKLFRLQEKFVTELQAMKDACGFRKSDKTNEEGHATANDPHQGEFGLADQAVLEVEEGAAKEADVGNGGQGQTIDTVSLNHPDTVGRQKNLIRRAEGDTTIAFCATLVHTVTNLGMNHILPFDTVLANAGNAYDVHTGVFKAPVSGLYVFSTTIAAENRSTTHLGLFKNSQRLTVIFTNGSENQWDGSSNTIIVHLSQNDDVTVRHTEANAGVHGDNHSMFSGFLLSQDDGQSIAIG